MWRKKVEVLQEAAWNELQQRVGSERLPRLLLRLAPLRSINPRVLEDLFFAGLIGRVSVASVVPYILSMQDCKTETETPMAWRQIFIVQYHQWPTIDSLLFCDSSVCFFNSFIFFFFHNIARRKKTFREVLKEFGKQLDGLLNPANPTIHCDCILVTILQRCTCWLLFLSFFRFPRQNGPRLRQ